MEIKENTIILEQQEFTADDLRGIADVMDNPRLISGDCNSLQEFIERTGLK